MRKLDEIERPPLASSFRAPYRMGAGARCQLAIWVRAFEVVYRPPCAQLGRIAMQKALLTSIVVLFSLSGAPAKAMPFGRCPVPRLT